MDYASVNTSKSIVENLEKMNLIGKWKVIPKLVNNDKEIEFDSKAISLLKKLVKERNAIVHSKSKAVTVDYIKKKEYLIKGKSISMDDVCKCINSCTEGLKKIDTTDYWFFNGDSFDAYKKYKPHKPI